nr:zinc finger, CCHC-type [Tanacetum cinerariifolium]
ESVKDMTRKFDKLTTRKRMKWENDDYIYHGHILNGMSDSLFDIYQNPESAKALWESLESKYMAEDASATKFLDDEVAWWVDSGATSYVCKDLRWFQVCKSIKDRSFVKMGNVATKPIEGIGRVLLTFTSGKPLSLDNVLYVPGIQKNLVFEIVLNKCGYKQVLESDKYILSRHGSFVGFGYVCNEPKDYVSVNSIIELRDAIFDEKWFTSIHRPRGMIQPSSSKIAKDEFKGNDDVPGPSVPRKSTRTRKAKSFGSDFQIYLVDEKRDKTLSQREYRFIIEEDPRTLSEAMASRDVAFWKEAVHSEIDSIMHNNTWELTDLPPGCKSLGSLVAIHDLVIHQMDVKTAFLNDDLDEEIHMKQPEGFVMPGHEIKPNNLPQCLGLYPLKLLVKSRLDCNGFKYSCFVILIMSLDLTFKHQDLYLETSP